MERLVQILNSYDRAAIVVQRVVKGWMGRRKVAPAVFRPLVGYCEYLL